ncbi:MAG TPA: ATP-binding protein [Kofleriaceae bacterium]|nr:ATP-binding protein [Kofleriaceae bacterium]
MTAYVLVVDDDEALRESVCELLEEEGVRAVPCDSGAAALAYLRAGHPPPAVILLDLMMPVMNGWQFRGEQRRDPALASIPVVAMTATRDVKGLEVDEVLFKPIGFHKLLEAVRRHVGAPAAPAPRRTEPPARPGGARAIALPAGDVARRLRVLDWASTPMGPIESWSPSLLTMLRTMLASRYAMWLGWGPDLCFFYNDAYAQQTLGAKHPRALGRPTREVWAEIWADIGPRIERVLSSGEATWDAGLRLFLERSGYPEETYHTFSYSPAPGDAGETAGLLCVVIEETERVIGERRLELVRALAARLASTSSVEDVGRAIEATLGGDGHDLPFSLTYLFEPDGRARLVARAGVDAADPIARPTVERADPTSPWQLDAVASGPRVVDLDPAVRWPTGPWRRPPARALVVPIAQAGQAAPAGVFIAGLNPHRPVDGSERSFVTLLVGQLAAALANARAYEQERRRAEALAELDRAKTTFFSNVSHELRTPLTLMLAPTEDLLDGACGPVSRAQREQLDLVHRNEQRLLKLVNSLLDVARIEAGRSQASYEPTDLAAFTRDLASAFRAAVERAGLWLRVTCEPTGEPVHVDRGMWEKIVLNLLSNALKFTFEGGITVDLAVEDGAAVLRVDDTGVGIPAEELPRLFDRFHRVEGARARTHEGTGIGLALVQELARLHGGSVFAESRPGAGSTFTVRVPIGTAHLPAERIAAETAAPAAVRAGAFVDEALRWLPSAADAPAERARAASEPGEAGAPGEAPAGRVLLADDNADMRDYVRRTLERHWTVVTAEDGARALALATADPPDLVLTDVMMPGLDGFGLLRELRANERTRLVPVIMLSARAGDEARVEGISAGADDYLVKPFAARELVARVRAHLELARLRRSLASERDRLRALLGQVPAIVNFLRGPDLVIEFIHPMARRTLGDRPLLGRPLLEAIPELRGHPNHADILRVLATGEPVELCEKLLRIDDGAGPRDTYWTSTYVPVRDDAGAIEGVMTFDVEVTDQVLARRASAASEDRLRRLVDQVRAGIAQVDLDGRITLVNERFREIAARSEEELLRLRLADLVHADDRAAHEAMFARLLETHAPFVIEQRHVRPDGSMVWLENNVSPSVDAEGRQVGAVVIGVDVTQRRLAEGATREALASERSAREHAERAARFSEMFVGILGHDLRNPLNAIMTAASLIELRTDAEPIRRPVSRIVASAGRMERMISQLLDFTRIRLGQGLPIANRRVDLAEVGRAIIDELHLVYRRELRWQALGDTVGSWDRDRLSQLLSNLVANACQHGTPGSAVSVVLDGTRDDAVHLVVRNEGTIPDGLLPTLFEPLQRAGERRRDGSSGLGLGLYITQQIAAGHGGTIAVASDPADGTRFSVHLPRDGRPPSS